MVVASGLIKVIPGLMIWTLVAFALTFYVLRKYAFGRRPTRSSSHSNAAG